MKVILPMDPYLPLRGVNLLERMAALDSGLYPQFLGVAGPSDLTNPLSTSSLEFVKILWPDCLCEYIAPQTNANAGLKTL